MGRNGGAGKVVNTASQQRPLPSKQCNMAPTRECTGKQSCRFARPAGVVEGAVKRKAAPVLAVSQARSTSVLAVGTYATARFDLSSSTPRISTPVHARRETCSLFLALYTALNHPPFHKHRSHTTFLRKYPPPHRPVCVISPSIPWTGLQFALCPPSSPPAAAIGTPLPSARLASPSLVAAAVGSAVQPLRERLGCSSCKATAFCSFARPRRKRWSAPANCKGTLAAGSNWHSPRYKEPAPARPHFPLPHTVAPR